MFAIAILTLSFLWIGLIENGIRQSISKKNREQKTNDPQNSLKLKGKWKVIGCQLHGIWLPFPIFEHFIYRFTDLEHYKLDWSELSFPQYRGGFPKSETGRISVNTNTSPHQIDLIPDKGEYAGQVFKGIFELDHDILKANFGLPGHARPSVFSAGQGQVYEVWQRIID